MTKIALVVGHNSRAQGAVRVLDGVSEYVWNGILARDLAAKDPKMYAIIRRPAGIGYSREIAQAYAEADRLGVKGTVELHFNAFNSVSTGTETLSSGTKGSRALAQLAQQAMLGALGLRDRGLVVLPSRNAGRGAESLWQGRAPAVLLEPYFGSNPSDCRAADSKYYNLVNCLHQAFCSF